MDITDEKLIDAKLARIEAELKARLDGMDKALILYAAEMSKNMEHLNQVRTEVLQDRTNYVTKEAFDVHLNKISENIKARWQAIIGWLIAIAALGLAYFKK